MNKEERLEQLRTQLILETYPKLPIGGQHAGMPVMGVRAKHEDLQFEVSCRYFRSVSANRQMCIDLFDLFLLEVVK